MNKESERKRELENKETVDNQQCLTTCLGGVYIRPCTCPGWDREPRRDTMHDNGLGEGKRRLGLN